MTPEMNNTQNQNPKNQSPKKKFTVARWIIGGFFAIFALANGFRFSSLFLLCAAFLMFPISLVDSFLQKKNIKTITAIILSVALFFVGAIASSTSKSTDSTPDNTTQTTTNDTQNKNNNYTNPDKIIYNDNTFTDPNNTTANNAPVAKPDNTTSNNKDKANPDNTTSTNKDTTKPNNTTSDNVPVTKPDNTTSDDENVTMVWLPSSGEKYHSKPNCSNMKSPRQVSLESAERQGYTPCSRCH